MALMAYLKLKGQKQGEIKGSVAQKGREGKIAVIAAEHELVAPRDAASGLPTGKRQHKPFMLTKEVDIATPRLYTLLANNEPLTDWELQFWTAQTKGAAGAGAEVQHYTVRLFDARLVGLQFQMPDLRDPALAKLAEREVLSFVYGRIQWAWTAGGLMAEDSWLDGPAAAAKPAPRKAARRAA